MKHLDIPTFQATPIGFEEIELVEAERIGLGVNDARDPRLSVSSANVLTNRNGPAVEYQTPFHAYDVHPVASREIFKSK